METEVTKTGENAVKNTTTHPVQRLLRDMVLNRKFRERRVVRKSFKGDDVTPFHEVLPGIRISNRVGQENEAPQEKNEYYQ